MGASGKLLVLVETVQGRPIGLAFEMLGLARRLADASGGTVDACVLGSGLDGACEALLAHGAARAYVVDSPSLADRHAEAWLPDVVAVIEQARPQAVVVGHTALGAELAPRLAFRLDTAVATGCIDVSAVNGKLRLTRPCYGGKAHEVVTIRVSPAVFTVKSKCFEPLPAQDVRNAEVVRLKSILDPASLRTRVREVRCDEAADARLESADIVVAGGGGMKGAHGFALAGRLAELLGGAVGASRVACDLGWCPPSYQVGLSGKTVAPQLYIAIGISGTGQHMAGCVNSKNIVAINTDRDAPIFRFARYGIVADCHEVIPALIETLEARRA
jgi:electron transfer flavoprotein alpha subunit